VPIVIDDDEVAACASRDSLAVETNQHHHQQQQQQQQQLHLSPVTLAPFTPAFGRVSSPVVPNSALLDLSIFRCKCLLLPQFAIRLFA
jgi:hypothetical protein